jgi:hypothetical protein
MHGDENVSMIRVHYSGIARRFIPLGPACMRREVQVRDTAADDSDSQTTVTGTSTSGNISC